jgi:predicted DNA-binding transcriptional regulator AlpA
MKRRRQEKSDGRASELASLRSVLSATGGQAKIEELYRVMRVEETARFLGLAVPTVQDMTYRHELPCVKLGARAVGYRLIDLIGWQEAHWRAPTR